MLSREVLFSMNDVKEEYLLDAQAALEDGIQRPRRPVRNLARTLLPAALIAALLIGTAWAAGLFSLRARRPAEPDETYTIRWAESPTGGLKWTDLKYVFQFDGADTCRAVKFRPGWLPFRPNAEYNQRDADGFYRRLVSEGAPGVDSTSHNYQPYMVEIHYVPQFIAEDGAMLLMYQTPEEITEEKWGEDTVLRFSAFRHQDEIALPDGRVIEEETFHYYFVIRFSESEGYIVVTSGTSDMETVEHVARELEIVPTDEIIRAEDFENHAVFIDVGQG